MKMRLSEPSSHRAEPARDDALVEACRRGDRAALGEVFRHHAPAIERLLVRLVGPRGDVEDLLQLTFIGAIDGFTRFQGKASVKTWLSRIAVHVVHQELRRPASQRRTRLELVHAEGSADPSAPPDRVAIARQRVERLYHHLDAIGSKKRLAYVLFTFEELPIAEVAALTGGSVPATKSRIFWARRELMRRAHHDPILRELLDGAKEGRE
jgi:RNA polymerase sigma-70 factor, ECF subfamily